MDAEAIHGITATASLTSASVGHVGPAAAQAPKAAPLPAAGGAATALISTPGQFYSELQGLAQNPAKFRSVAAQVALLFEAAASKASGSEAQVLADLANRFSLAAQTGVLPPPGGAQAQAAPPQSAPPVRPSIAGGPAHFYDSNAGATLQSSAIHEAFVNALRVVTRAAPADASR